ncbi:MAG TPA: hypothetical protein VK012_00505 [Gemmatimonadales bacterium]|nr:hypothetical protein [Gemmatimonadales bacterium]
MTQSLLIGVPTIRPAGRGTRVSALVGGIEAWFESDELPLQPSPEAFASAFLIPAAAEGRQLELEAPICPVWRSGAADLLPVIGGWWGYRSEVPDGVRRVAAGPALDGKTALCFSGGVDAFYSLLRYPGVDLLVAAHGFDIPRAETRRMAAFERSLREVAQALGIRAGVIRTNLREHPHFAGVSWERTHGGALAALGHLLSDSVSRLVISSSAARRDEHPWGSHWQTDPLWSSSRMAVEHFGEAVRRGDKLIEIADHPLVQQHLRVCWENANADVNCSRCEKCIRTELILAACGKHDDFPVFQPGATLARRVDGIAKVPETPLLIPYRAALQSGLDPAVARAVRALLRRSRRAQMRRRVRGLVGVLRRSLIPPRASAPAVTTASAAAPTAVTGTAASPAPASPVTATPSRSLNLVQS